MTDDFLSHRTAYDRQMNSVYGNIASQPYGPYTQRDMSKYPPGTQTVEGFCNGCTSDGWDLNDAYNAQILPSGFDITQYRTAFDQQMQTTYGPIAAAPYGPYNERDWSIYYPATPTTTEGFRRGGRSQTAQRTQTLRRRVRENFSPCSCTNINLNRSYY